MRREREIEVWDGATFLGRHVCTESADANGRPAVLWRGVIHALDGEERIDLAAPRAEGPPDSAHAVLGTEDATWVLVNGLADALNAAQQRLAGAGCMVQATGRWLGEPVDGRSFDWFIRCASTIGPNRIAQARGAASVAELAPVDRLALVEGQLLETRAELARLRAALELAAARPAPEPYPATPAEPDPQPLADALARIRELEEKLATPSSRPPPPTRAATLVEDAFAALRPDLRLLRDSLDVLLRAFPSRAGFCRALRDLPPAGGRPEGWKALRGAERWWERHVSTGHDDSGRIYARFRTETRDWDILLSVKENQSRDIAWLRAS